jgi:hypothetical protein
MRAAFLIVIACVAIACVHSRALPLGTPAPPRPHGCPIALEHALPNEASARWRQVGIVCIVEEGHHYTVDEVYAPGDGHDRLVDEACSLGGEHVTPTGFCTLARTSGIEFGVYVDKTNSP